MAIRPGETPVPIPNTMVKARTADGTALETVWESRWPPDHKKLNEGETNFIVIKTGLEKLQNFRFLKEMRAF